MDWIAFALESQRQGRSLADILEAVPPEQRQAVREALEAAQWLEERAPAWQQFARERAPRWEQVASRLPERVPPRRIRRPLAWRWALALALMLMAALGTLGNAAAHALPGDWAYPLRRTVEQVRYLATQDEEQRLNLQLHFADQRLQDAQALLARGDLPAAQQALEEYRSHWRLALQLSTALGEQTLQGLEQALTRHQAHLEVMIAQQKAPPEALFQALQLVESYREQVRHRLGKPDAAPDHGRHDDQGQGPAKGSENDKDDPQQGKHQGQHDDGSNGNQGNGSDQKNEQDKGKDADKGKGSGKQQDNGRGQAPPPSKQEGNGSPNNAGHQGTQGGGGHGGQGNAPGQGANNGNGNSNSNSASNDAQGSGGSGRGKP